VNSSRLSQIRALKTVAEAHAWRKAAGELDSMEYLALIVRIDALRKAEVGQ
jgi:hypothetical protein